MFNKKNYAAVGLTALSATIVGSLSPAQAVTPTLPTCDAMKTMTNTQIDAALKVYNDSKTGVYHSSAAYKAAKKKVTDATAAVAKAKKIKNAKSRAAAVKTANAKLTSAKTALASAESKALAVVHVKRFSATVTPNMVDATAGDPTYSGKWNWGTYTSHVLVKNKVVQNICLVVDETGAKSETDVVPTSGDATKDLEVSVATYQEPVIPVLRTEALNGDLNDQSVILARVSAKVVSELFGDGATASTTRTGYTNIGSMSGATYTVEGFYNSLQQALLLSPVKA
jgi:hypothetical protein